MKNTFLLIFVSSCLTLAQGQADPIRKLNLRISPEDAARLKAAGEVYYGDFGAKGDGQTDDIEAIAAAHEFANQNGLAVRANDQATYYIGGKERTVNIQTDTDFGTASFIIDDTNVENRSASVFRVSSTLQSFELETVSSLKKNQDKINVSLSGPSLVTAVNANVKHYIRKGLNQDVGYPQTDIFLVDQDGNVDSSTPIIWDFDQITSLYALPIDQSENTLTIKGGRFTTLANDDVSEYNYYDRNFEITRSHVVVDGLEHYVEAEGEQGAPYAGFIDIHNCAYVTIKNAALTGHKTYYTTGSAGKPVAMGTYDITVGRALNVSFVNCRQTNDIKDPQYWGIMGSNYGKNILYDSCILSRFDAHRGVNNATIRNSTLGYMGANAIGSGILTLENTTVYANNLVNLRSDYGSTWQGSLIIRDCTFAPDTSRTGRITLIGGFNSGDHDFGYPCYLPEEIIIENLRIDDAYYPEDYPGPAIIADFNPDLKDESYQEDFPYVATGEVILSEVTIASDKALRLSDNLFMFRNVTMTERQEPNQGETIQVYAQGSTGEEQIVLSADGVAQGEAIRLSTTMTDYSLSVEEPYTDLEIAFVNDGNTADGTDKNVRIDYLVAGQDTLQAEDQVTNTGSWNQERSQCGGVPSEWLYCGGYIVFGSNNTFTPATASSLPAVSSELSLFPNPSDGWVTLRLPKAMQENVAIDVLNSEGRIVHHQALRDGKRSKLPVSHLSPGTYLVRVSVSGQQATQRLVVK